MNTQRVSGSVFRSDVVCNNTEACSMPKIDLPKASKPYRPSREACAPTKLSALMSWRNHRTSWWTYHLLLLLFCEPCIWIVIMLRFTIGRCVLAYAVFFDVAHRQGSTMFTQQDGLRCPELTRKIQVFLGQSAHLTDMGKKSTRTADWWQWPEVKQLTGRQARTTKSNVER